MIGRDNPFERQKGNRMSRLAPHGQLTANSTYGPD